MHRLPREGLRAASSHLGLCGWGGDGASGQHIVCSQIGTAANAPRARGARLINKWGAPQICNEDHEDMDALENKNHLSFGSK